MNYIQDIQLKENTTYWGIIEIPKKTNVKWELQDKTFDKLIPIRKVIGKYPFYYGCFAQTLAGDNDPLDMVLLSNRARGQLDIVNVVPIGVLKTLDNDEQDDKIFVIDPSEKIDNIEKLKSRAIQFFRTYKGKKANMIIQGYDGAEISAKLIEEAHANFIERNSVKALKFN